MKSKIITLIALLVGAYLIISFTIDIFNLARRGDEVKKAEDKATALKQKNQELKHQLEYVKTDNFVEKEAREKLGLSKEGEVTYVLPENIEELSKPKEEKIVEIPNWEKWWKLFF